jgi:hypothetical protein
MHDHSESQILVVDDMPRYFFHISRGKHTFTDSAGVELVGIAAARTHATTKIRDMRATLPSGHLQDWSGWTMTVVDAKGKTVLEIGFDLSPRPLN